MLLTSLLISKEKGQQQSRIFLYTPPPPKTQNCNLYRGFLVHPQHGRLFYILFFTNGSFSSMDIRLQDYLPLPVIYIINIWILSSQVYINPDFYLGELLFCLCDPVSRLQYSTLENDRIQEIQFQMQGLSNFFKSKYIGTWGNIT